MYVYVQYVYTYMYACKHVCMHSVLSILCYLSFFLDHSLSCLQKSVLQNPFLACSDSEDEKPESCSRGETTDVDSERLTLPSGELNPRLWDWKSDAVPTECSGFWFYPDDCLGHLSWEMLEVATSFEIAADISLTQWLILMWAGWTVKLRKTGATEPKKCCFAPTPWQKYLGLLVSNWLCPSWPVFLISACD